MNEFPKYFFPGPDEEPTPQANAAGSRFESEPYVTLADNLSQLLQTLPPTVMVHDIATLVQETCFPSKIIEMEHRVQRRKQVAAIRNFASMLDCDREAPLVIEALLAVRWVTPSVDPETGKVRYKLATIPQARETVKHHRYTLRDDATKAAIAFLLEQAFAVPGQDAES